MNINGTIEEIQVLDNQTRLSYGRLAVLYDSLKKINELMISLTEEEIADMKRDTEANPALKSIIQDFVQERLAVVSEPLLPGFLTINDVSEILGITPQSVRRHCSDGKIKAWRTLGNTGEWRIDIDEYKHHSRFHLIADKYAKRNRKVSEFIATNESLTNQLRNAEARRNYATYYNNDIERFNKLVDESE